MCKELVDALVGHKICATGTWRVFVMALFVRMRCDTAKND